MKYIIILLSILNTANAATLIVDSPSGEQKSVNIHVTGGYFDKSRVVWDTRSDGPIPNYDALGGLYKCGQALCVDDGKKAIHDAVITAKVQAASREEAIDSDLQTRRQQIEALLDDWDNVTNAQLKQIIRYFVKKELRR